jgi:hypothetical protein
VRDVWQSQDAPPSDTDETSEVKSVKQPPYRAKNSASQADQTAEKAMKHELSRANPNTCAELRVAENRTIYDRLPQ